MTETIAIAALINYNKAIAENSNNKKNKFK